VQIPGGGEASLLTRVEDGDALRSGRDLTSCLILVHLAGMLRLLARARWKLLLLNAIHRFAGQKPN
jgi:hypothetical protein